MCKEKLTLKFMHLQIRLTLLRTPKSNCGCSIPLLGFGLISSIRSMPSLVLTCICSPNVQPTIIDQCFEVVMPLSSQLPAFVLILQFQLWRSVKFWPNFCLFSFCTLEVAAMAVVARFWSNFLSSCGQSAKVAIVSFASN